MISKTGIAMRRNEIKCRLAELFAQRLSDFQGRPVTAIMAHKADNLHRERYRDDLIFRATVDTLVAETMGVYETLDRESESD